MFLISKKLSEKPNFGFILHEHDKTVKDIFELRFN